MTTATPLTPMNCCGARIGGLKTAHCTVCHATFTTPPGFDRHRRRGKCIPPETIEDNSGARVFKEAGRNYPCWAFVSGEKHWEEEE